MTPCEVASNVSWAMGVLTGMGVGVGSYVAFRQRIAAFRARRRAGRTVVHLRSGSTPVQHWDAVVKYDPWGTPYVPGCFWSDCARGMRVVLLPDGGTEDWLWDTEWRLKSGPEVTFGERPKDRFTRSKEMTL